MHANHLRTAVAVVAAGIAGTLANAVAAAILVDGDLIRLALVPGRYLVAILVAAVLPFASRLRGRMASTAAAFAALTVAPSLLAKLAFGAGAPWAMVLGLNAVYGVAALLVYRIAIVPVQGRQAA